MTVFKLSLRIMKSNITSLLIFLAVFLGISILVSGSAADMERLEFSQARVPVAFFTEESTPLVNGLVQELSKVAEIISLPDDNEVLLDALFFGDITYVLRVPEGFTADFLKNQSAQIIKSSGQNTSAAEYVEMAVNRYLNAARVYLHLLPEYSQRELLGMLEDDLAVSIDVQISSSGDIKNDFLQARMYFNYLAYSLFAILILGISTNILVFQTPEIRMRNACSPLKSRRLNLQLFGSNFAYAVFCWIVMSGFCLLFLGDLVASPQMLLFILNAFLLTFWASCFSFFIGQVVKSRNGISAVANVAALGTSFTAGVFVPQEILGVEVLRAASFTPTYWYVLANRQIAELSQVTIASVTPLFGPAGLQIGFGAAFLAMALVVSKRKQRV